MTAQNPCLALEDASGFNAALLRQACSFPVGSLGGVVNQGDWAVTAGGTWNFHVAPGEGWIPGSSLAAISGTPANPQGQYFCFLDAAYTIAITPQNATNPRIDLICATVTDQQYVGGSSSSWTPSYVEGTATSGASLSNMSGAASVPVDSIPLAWVLVPNGTSGDAASCTIQDARPMLYPSIDLSSGLIEHDVAGGGNPNTSSIDITQSGLWIVEVNIFVYNASGSPCAGQVELQQNGSTIREWTASFLAGQKDNVGTTVPVQCAEGDALQLVYNNTGSPTINFASGAPSSWNTFAAYWQHP